MKILSVVGTVAMFWWAAALSCTVSRRCIMPLNSSGFPGVVSMLLSNGANLVLGFIVGSIVLLVVNLVAKLRGKSV